MAITDAGLGLSFGQTGSTFFQNVIRDHFLDEVADCINHEYALQTRWQKLVTANFVRGKNIVQPAHTSRNPTSVGAVGYVPGATATRGKLPDPKSEGYQQYAYPYRSMYARLLVDGLTEDASMDDLDSWLRAWESEMISARDNLARQENRIIHNDGTGIHAYTSDAAGANSATQTMTGLNPLVESPTTMDAAAMATTYWFQVAGRYSAIRTDTGAIVGTRTVVSKTTTSVTFDASIDLTPTPTDFYWVTANNTSAGLADTGYQREPMGIAGMVSDANTTAYFESALASTFQGINATTAGNEFNQANILTNGAVTRQLTEALLQQGFTRAARVLGGKPTVGICSFGVRDAFSEVLLAYRQQVNTMELQGGFDALGYNNIPLIPDRDCYPNRIYLLDERDFQQHVVGTEKYRMMDKDQTYVRLPDEDAYQMTLFRRYTHGTGCRGLHVLITDLIEAST